MRCVPALLLVLLASGCTRQRIDGSSEEAFQASYERMRDSLNDEDRARFDEAMRAIGVADLRAHYSEDADPDEATRSVLRRLDGKTAEDIIREASELPREGR